MEVTFSDFGIYHVDETYLKHLHDDVDSEVYYSPDRYETKPFLGITVGIGLYTYFIPFSSSKPKHLNWSNVARDHYLIYEIVDRKKLSPNAIYRPSDGTMVTHILSVLDIKKMIPVPEGLYEKVDFKQIKDASYRVLLEKEYRFCRRIQDGISKRVTKIYEEQKSKGTIHRFYCNFSALEFACNSYLKHSDAEQLKTCEALRDK